VIGAVGLGIVVVALALRPGKGKGDRPADATADRPGAAADPAGAAFFPGLPAVSPARPAPPPGWVEFRDPDGAFRVNTPGPVRSAGRTTGNRRDPDSHEYVRAAAYLYFPPDGRPHGCMILTAELRPEVAPHYERALSQPDNPTAQPLLQTFGVKSMTRSTLGGRPAVELVVEHDLEKMAAAFLPDGKKFTDQVREMEKRAKGPDGRPVPEPSFKTAMVKRSTISGTRLYEFALVSAGGVPADADRKAFFDSVEFLK
jgi:hypothetical protein